jgi:transketolase
MPIEPVTDKWRSFGWNVLECDGHDIPAISKTLDEAKAHKGKPTFIVAHTIKGKGVSFMEHQISWHGAAPNKELTEKALGELRKINELLKEGK